MFNIELRNPGNGFDIVLVTFLIGAFWGVKNRVV